MVSGNGSVEVPPDLARVHFGVMERGATATDASNAVQRKMQAVLAALGQAQVPAAQVQTDRLYLRENPDYRYRQQQMIRNGVKPEKPQAPATDRYIAQHSVSVELKDLNKVGAVLAAVQNAGVNQIENVSFELQDREEAIAQARNNAIQKAQGSAKRIAQEAGVTLGALVYISTSQEGGGFGGGGGARPMLMAAKGESAVAPPVQPGKLKFNAQVYLRYEIAGQRAPTTQAQPAAAGAK